MSWIPQSADSEPFTLVLVLQIRFLDPSCKFNLKN